MVAHGITAAADSVAQLLATDHRRLDAILAEAKRWLAGGDLARASARFSEFREGLERHIDAEEAVLFPVFENLPANEERSTRGMRSEHAELRRLLAEVASSLERPGDEGHTTPLAALTARIYAHNGKEERGLYPEADRLTRDTPVLEELRRRLHRAGP